jgi:hypothetical protein
MTNKDKSFLDKIKRSLDEKYYKYKARELRVNSLLKPKKKDE